VWRTPEEPVRLAGDGVELRPFERADLPALVAAFTDREIVRWNPGPAAADLPGGAEQWMSRRNDWSGGDHASWAVGDPAGALLGSVSVHQIDVDQGDAAIGYWIAPWARGRRLGALAVGIATGFAFDALRLRRLCLYHATDNPASCRVALAAGYRLEGTLRQSHRYADGRVHDEHVHGRLAADHPAATP
jgi:RimJ/RimL family protein N-acetyltransferase